MISKTGCYRRPIAEEREEISRKLAKGESFQAIAGHLGRSVSTIAREVSRGGCNRWTYRADRAQRRSRRNARRRRLGKRKLFFEQSVERIRPEEAESLLVTTTDCQADRNTVSFRYEYAYISRSDLCLCVCLAEGNTEERTDPWFQAQP